LDNLNLGGHGGIAGLGSEETNQYSAKWSSPQRTPRITRGAQSGSIPRVSRRSRWWVFDRGVRGELPPRSLS